MAVAVNLQRVASQTTLTTTTGLPLQALTLIVDRNPPALLLEQPLPILPMIAIQLLVSGFFTYVGCIGITRGAAGTSGPSAADRDREDMMNDIMRLKESSIVGQEVPTSSNDKVSYQFFFKTLMPGRESCGTGVLSSN